MTAIRMAISKKTSNKEVRWRISFHASIHREPPSHG
jgi:hypothetical protein